MSRCALTRLVWLLQRFREAKRPLSALELAQDYERSQKTIYRDMETLRDLGCDIETVPGPDNCRPIYLGSRLVNKDFCPFCACEKGHHHGHETPLQSRATPLASVRAQMPGARR